MADEDQEKGKGVDLSMIASYHSALIREDVPENSFGERGPAVDRFLRRGR